MRRIFVSTLATVALTAGSAPAQRAPSARPPVVVAPMRPPPVRGFDDAGDLARRQAARRVEAATDTRTASRIPEPSEVRRAIRAAYERSNLGHWRRRGEIVVATGEPGSDAAARTLGLREVRRSVLAAMGLTLTTYAAADGARTEDLVRALQAARPQDVVDLNWIYEFDGEPGSGVPAARPAPSSPAGKVRIAAVIDGGLPDDISALAGIQLRRTRFGPGAGQPGPHALAVATVLADAAGRDNLLVLAADVSETGPLPGASAAAIAQALDWAVAGRAEVINVSLTGPPSAILATVVMRAAARGVTIVAAAGNAGPRAAAPYPAALPEVVGVTAVDARLRIWRRATQGSHVDFAAQGVKVGAAGGVWTGTSFAAPVVAGLLLRWGGGGGVLASHARDLGLPGRDPVYGLGYLAGS